MRTNKPARNTLVTSEGAPAHAMNPTQALRRSVMSCLLFEKESYESGEEIATRIERLAREVPPEILADLAVEVRTQGNLRHAPLPLLFVLAETGKGQPDLVRRAVRDTIQRADELAELIAFFRARPRADGSKRPIPWAVRRGIADAFGKFSEYNLAKYDRDNAVKLRDVLRIVRPQPQDEAQSALYKKVIDRTLETPDTWEVALSGGADKKEAFTRLLQEGKLGYFALLRNLRNMEQSGVDLDLVREAILARKGEAERILPFRFIAAARACPRLEGALDTAMGASIAALPQLKGETIVLVDVSGSMSARLSAKSDLTRMDAACALGSIVNAERLRVFSFSNQLVEVPARRGMAGVDAIRRSQHHGGTRLDTAVAYANTMKHDRLIVVTDEQAQYKVPDPMAKHAYVVNVASARNGIGYGAWVHVDGFSENVLRWIHEYEREFVD
jgi:60 kDa SS-A/Ro ribonucleoprotein